MAHETSLHLELQHSLPQPSRVPERTFNEFLGPWSIRPKLEDPPSIDDMEHVARKFSPYGNAGVYIHTILHVYDTLRRKRRCVKIAFITVVLNFDKNIFFIE